MGGYEWYALQTKARHEKVVFTALLGKSYEALLPTYRVWHHSGGRLRTADLPLFSGYVFSRFDVNVRMPILTIPGVLNVVGFGEPLAIDKSEVDAISRICQAELPRRPWPFLRVGDRVRVECGPLKGLEGIYLRDQNQDRLILSMTLLQRSVAVQMERGSVRPLHLTIPGLSAA